MSTLSSISFLGKNVYLRQVCRSCSTFFIEHDIKIYVFVVLDDNCPTRPTYWKIMKVGTAHAFPTLRSDGTKIIEKKLGDIEGTISKNPKTNKWSLTSFKMPELILDNGKIEHILGSVIDAIEQRVPKRFGKQLNEVVENFAKSLLKMK